MPNTETTMPAPQGAADTRGFAAGAEIYRRLERRPRGPSVALLIAIIAVLLLVTGGVIAYLLQPVATHPAAQSQSSASSPRPTSNAP